MKVAALSLVAGLGGTLILAGPAPAGFTGIKVVSKPNAFGLLVCNVFASFDRPGEDQFRSAGGTPNSPMDIHVVGGTFYQHPFGTDTPPAAPLLVNPSLAFDTFVTIGVKAVGIPGGQFPDNLELTPGWPGFGPSSLGGTALAWQVMANDPQANPFNPDYVNGNGQVLISQFSTADGTGITGMFKILAISNGTTMQFNVTFFHVPGPGAMALLATSALWWRPRPRRRPDRRTTRAAPSRS